MDEDRLRVVNFDDMSPEERFQLCGVYYPKVPVCRRPEYEIVYEQFGANTFVHIRFFVPWTRSVKAKLAADVETLAALHGGPLMALSSPTDLKHQKFSALFGFLPKLYLPANGEGEDKLILIRSQEERATNGQRQPIRRVQADHQLHNEHQHIAECGDAPVPTDGIEHGGRATGRTGRPGLLHRPTVRGTEPDTAGGPQPDHRVRKRSRRKRR